MRLLQGDFAAETVYDDDPVAVARAFAAAGRAWIHVVDLDAARTGEPANLAVIEAIAARGRLQGAGRRRSAQRRPRPTRCSLAGAARVVVGTAAVEHPELVDELCARASRAAVAVGLDARGREVAVRGWVEGSGADLVELAARFEASGVAALVVTEIGRDGTLEGPTLDQLRAVLAADRAPGDRERRRRRRSTTSWPSPRSQVGGRRLAGAIVGPGALRGPIHGRRGAVDALGRTVTGRGDRGYGRGHDTAHRAVGGAGRRGYAHERTGVIDEGFLRRYRELLDAEDAAFDELEHAYEEGDRAHYEHDLEQWQAHASKRRAAFLDRHGMRPASRRSIRAIRRPPACRDRRCTRTRSTSRGARTPRAAATTRSVRPTKKWRRPATTSTRRRRASCRGRHAHVVGLDGPRRARPSTSELGRERRARRVEARRRSAAAARSRSQPATRVVGRSRAPCRRRTTSRRARAAGIGRATARVERVDRGDDVGAFAAPLVPRAAAALDARGS